MDSPLSPAVDNMEALADMLIQTDLSGLQEIPEEDKTSFAISGSSNAPTLADEPYKHCAEVERVKKPKMACRLPFKKDGTTPCHHPTFTRFDAMKKHFKKDHSEAQQPKWTKERGGKPVGYEDIQEDTGPMVMCRSVSVVSSKLYIFARMRGCMKVMKSKDFNTHWGGKELFIYPT